MKQVLRNEWLRDCLEKLEPFRSLWMGFQLGSFPLILSWRCAQEIECYLEKMYRIWYTITGGETYLCDEYTVEKLGGLAPLWSAHDRSLIESLFAAGHIFPRVRDPAVRARISQKVLTVEGFVLTFQTFFKQVKILGPIMHPLRELFPASDFYPSRGEFSLDSRRLPSVRDILLQRWRERPEPNKQQYVLQYNEIDDRSVECSDPGLYSYWQLCLYLLRHSQGHQGFPKTQYRAEPSERPGWVVRLGQFARRLGFESEQISLLCNQDPNLSQIRIHLLEERPSTFFSAPADKFDAEAHSRQRGQAIFDYRPPTVTPLMTTDSATVMRVPRTHPELFLPTIWSALTQQPRYALTEYGALVLICLSFFEGFGSNSVANVGEGPQPVPSLLRSSSVYSVPAYPDSHRASITFWHLPQRRDMSPLAEYICDTTIKDIEKVVNNIRAQGQAPLFALVDSDGRLRLCDPSQILVALLEAQNRQLRDAVQTLYEHIQAGHELPILPARSPEDNRPLVHDIIEYINTLRESTTTIPEQAQPQVVLPKTMPTVSLLQSQLATPLPLAVAVSVPDLGTFAATSTQHSFPFMAYNASQMNYECLESEVD
ncbi:hypothetical protein BM1_04794 [Bipolaris maydis]|nr:hypothetical protein BM1_04794 [Bipolaris maydis]